jgi:hypothetical protein
VSASAALPACRSKLEGLIAGRISLRIDDLNSHDRYVQG